MEYKYRSNTLERLGLKSWLNAKNWSTEYGGNWIDDRVLESMNEVAKTFVNMYDLYTRASQRIAELSKADNAYVSCGAAAAIELVVASCIANDNLSAWKALPDTSAANNEVVMPMGHIISYHNAWKSCGAKIVTYGLADTLDNITFEEIESAITEKTCCLGYVESYNVLPRGRLLITDVAKVAKKYDLPLVVDAAAMLPPVSNLHNYFDLGADVVVFSGGKAIKAPNNTGFALGKGAKGKNLIDNLFKFSFPNHGFGRSFKVSKEQIVGLIVALEIFIKEGDKYYDHQMKIANKIAQELAHIPNLTTTVIPNDENYHEHPAMPLVPRVKIEWDPEQVKLTPDELDQAAAENDPPVALRGSYYYQYYTNKPWRLIDTYYLREGEEQIIIDSLRRIFSSYS